MLAVGAHEKGLDLTCLVEPGVPSLLRGDPGRLRQIVLNMAGNALKFTDQGEVEIRVSLEHDTDQSVTLHFTIRDTGIGIPASHHGRLFSTFTQVDGSTTRKYGGTGLGLAISKQLATKMGGSIGVESEPGKGSTFWFTAVFARQSDSPVEPAPEHTEIEGLHVLVADDHQTNLSLVVDRKASARTDMHQPIITRHVLAEATRRNARILLVEDNPTNQKVTQAILKKRGYRVDVAANGLEAINALSRLPYDLVLMDCQMPEMDGFEATTSIRDPASAVLNPQVPIIAMTALAMKGDRERCLDVGMNDYITKPIEPGKLTELVKEWLPES